METNENLSEYADFSEAGQQQPVTPDIAITSSPDDNVSTKVGELMGSFVGLQQKPPVVASPPKATEPEVEQQTQNEPELSEYAPLEGSASEPQAEPSQSAKDASPDLQEAAREMGAKIMVQSFNDGQAFCFEQIYDYRNAIHKERATAEQSRIMGKLARNKYTPLDLKRLEYCNKFLADYATREAKYKKSLSISEKEVDTIQKALELEMQMRGITVSPLLAALGTIGYRMVSNVSGVVDSQPFNPPVG